MATKRVPNVGQDQGSWGQILNNHLSQLQNPNTGAINSWTTSTRPTNLNSDDEGLTGINTDLQAIESWNGTAWYQLIKKPHFEIIRLWDFVYPVVGQVRQTTTNSFYNLYTRPVEFDPNGCILDIPSHSILRIKTTGGDPYFQYYLKSLERFKGNEYPIVKIKYKKVAPIQSSTTQAQIFFSYEGSNFGPQNSIFFDIINDGNWHEVEINLSSNSFWNNGFINGFRFDLPDQNSEYDFDYIAVGTYENRNTDFGLVDADDKVRVVKAPMMVQNFLKVQKEAFGTYDNGAVASIIANREGNENPAGVLGFPEPKDTVIYSDRDSVGLYIENTGLPATVTFQDAQTTYTADSITSTSSLNLSKVQIGMLIDTKHGPKYTGVVTDVDQESNTIYVAGWFIQGSNPPQSGTPTNGIGAFVNPIIKVWGQNTNIFLTPQSHAVAGAGYELGILDSNPNTQYTWGYDCVNLGQYKAGISFIQRGPFKVGFQANSADVAFQANGLPSTPAVIELKTNDSQTGPRIIGTVNFASNIYPNIAQIKAFVTGNTDDSGDLAFFTTQISQNTGERMRITSNGRVGIGTSQPTSPLQVTNIPEYADNSAAISGGLTAGAFYRTGDILKVVH